MNQSSEIVQSDLTKLAGHIQHLHQQCIAAARKTVDHAIAVGELLLQAKALVGHGAWLQWVEDNCKISESTTRRYMRLARNKNEVLEHAKSVIMTDLTVTEAYQLLAPPAASQLPEPEVAHVASLEQQIEFFMSKMPAPGQRVMALTPDGWPKECICFLGSRRWPGHIYEGDTFNGTICFGHKPMKIIEPVARLLVSKSMLTVGDMHDQVNGNIEDWTWIGPDDVELWDEDAKGSADWPYYTEPTIIFGMMSVDIWERDGRGHIISQRQTEGAG